MNQPFAGGSGPFDLGPAPLRLGTCTTSWTKGFLVTQAGALPFVWCGTSGAPRVLPFPRDASASFGRTNFPCAGPFVFTKPMPISVMHPYTMTAQARTKRGLWGYLFMGRKVCNLNSTVIEIGAYPGLGAMDTY